jgi:WD40 repeat protein
VAGDPLPARALARFGTTRFRHGSYVFGCAFTPDGKQLLTWGWDGLCAWDAGSGRQAGRVPYDSRRMLEAVAPSPDGKLLATLEHTGHGSAIRLWDRTTLEPLRQVGGEDLHRRSLSFTPDGKRLLTLGARGQMELWDVADGRPLRAWPDEETEDRIRVGMFLPDGPTLLVGVPGSRAIRVWDTATGKKLRDLDISPDDESIRLSHMALSPDGKVLATAGRPPLGYLSPPKQHAVRLWDVGSGKELGRCVWRPRNPAAPGTYFQGLAFCPNGAAVLAGTADEGVLVVDAPSGRESRRLLRGARDLSSLAVSPDGKTLATVVDRRTVRLTDLATGKDVTRLVGHEHELLALALAPDGRTAASTGGVGVALWDVGTGREIRRIEGHARPVTGVRFLDGGRSLVSVGADQTLRVWDTASAKERCHLVLRDAILGGATAAFSADGTLVAVGRGDRSVLLVALPAGKEVARIARAHDQPLCGLALTNDGHFLAAWDMKHALRVWDTRDLRERNRFDFLEGCADAAPLPAAGPGASCYAAALSPDGRLAAFSGQGKFVVIRELATAKLVRLADRLPDDVCALAFSPDGRALACSGLREPAVRLVEVASGQERCRFDGHRGRVLALAFSADGRRLVSGGQDTTALVWDLTGGPAGHAAPLTKADLTSCWDDLAGQDAAVAYRAVCHLAAAPAGVALLAERLRPVPRADEERLARLIADLDSDQFAVRDRAARELEAAGESAAAACRRALAGRPSAEVRRRLEGLLAEWAGQEGAAAPEGLRRVRALEVLERAGTAEARRVLAALAGGAPGAAPTEQAAAALRRLGEGP